MDRFVVVLSLIFSISLANSYGQSLDEVSYKLDSLEISKKALQIKIKTLQRMLHETKIDIAEFNQLKIKLGGELSKDPDVVRVKINSLGGVLRDKPSSTGNEIKKLSSGEEILAYKWQQNLYFKVSSKGEYGFVNYSSIETNTEIDDFLMDQNDKSKKANELSVSKLARLTKLYGHDKAKKILNKELFKGMTQGMVRESLGNPETVSKFENAKESWIYKNKELLFVNGDLIEW